MRALCMLVTCLSCAVAQSLTASTPLTSYDLTMTMYFMPSSYPDVCPFDKYIMYQCGRKNLEIQRILGERPHSIQILEMNHV
ncbi:unnamed protein product [Soboliphyme baturini]|uniref:Lipocalin n=1 Tax=Soboliphyme baturini TaxID=241478 RepID=A0A183JA22_9BILA|nr:unnamed protein product [Soboliphyme baturini]